MKNTIKERYLISFFIFYLEISFYYQHFFNSRFFFRAISVPFWHGRMIMPILHRDNTRIVPQQGGKKKPFSRDGTQRTRENLRAGETDQSAPGFVGLYARRTSVRFPPSRKCEIVSRLIVSNTHSPASSTDVILYGGIASSQFQLS